MCALLEKEIMMSFFSFFQSLTDSYFSIFSEIAVDYTTKIKITTSLYVTLNYRMVLDSYIFHSCIPNNSNALFLCFLIL